MARGSACAAWRRRPSGGPAVARFGGCVCARGWGTLDERMMPLCPCEIIVSPRVDAVGLADWLSQQPALTKVIL